MISLNVSVSDGDFRAETNAVITVYVIGDNDAAPSFGDMTVYNISIPEGVTVGTVVHPTESLFATDDDLPNLHLDACPNISSEYNFISQISYRVLENDVPFTINANGSLYFVTSRYMDYETDKHNYTMTIVATDGELQSLKPLKVYIELVKY